MKKTLLLLLALILVFSLTACGGNDAPATDEPAPVEETTDDAGNEETADEPVAVDGDYKIGIMTGTVSQGEEEFRAGEKLANDNPGKVVHVTYPDKFAQEQETTISNLKSLASDEAVKAIIVVQAVPGTAPGIDAVRESRPDMLFIAGSPHEDPDTISARADICIDLNQVQRGYDIMQTAKDMGAKTFVHYSFPRHMSYELLAARRDALKAAAEEMDIEFVEIDAPDPTGDAGTPGAQQFILEDVPRVVEQYGKDTAFFSTNCGMQEPLIKSVLNEGAIFPEQCCPSPYHAYPGAIGVEIPADKAGDLDYLNEQIAEKIAEKGGTGRFATWLKPANVAMINAAYEYACAFAEGEVDRQDMDFMIQCLKDATDDTANAELMEGYDNFLLINIGSIVY